MPISFSELWEQAEEISKSNATSTKEIFIELEKGIKEYVKLENIPSQDIQNILKTKKFGEILFKLTELSRIDNINSYAALHMEIQIAKKLA